MVPVAGSTLFVVVVVESFCWSSEVVIGLGLPFGGRMGVVVEFDIKVDDDDDDVVVVVVVVVLVGIDEFIFTPLLCARLRFKSCNICERSFEDSNARSSLDRLAVGVVDFVDFGDFADFADFLRIF